MDEKELLKKYTVLSEELKRLKKENSRLRAHLGLTACEPPGETPEEIKSVEKTPCGKSIPHHFKSVIDNTSDSCTKIHLFMSLFKSRSDVYAKRWENKNKGTSGYSPVCLNQWQAGVCGKPKIPCSKCKNKVLLRISWRRTIFFNQSIVAIRNKDAARFCQALHFRGKIHGIPPAV